MNGDSFFINNHRTIPMEEEIKRCDSYDEFERRFSKDLLQQNSRVGEYLSKLLRHHDKKDTTVSTEIYCSPSYVNNIINGAIKEPSRNTLLSICIAIEATFDEAQYLLKYAGYAPLYVRNRRDVVIWFGLMKGENLDTVNGNLKSRSLEPLNEEKPEKKRKNKAVAKTTTDTSRD